MRGTHPKVDALLDDLEHWQAESRELRRIILECDLVEEFKWRQPCYTLDGSNIVIIQGFKDYCAIMFFKGALLEDPDEILDRPGKTHAGRQIRFTKLQDIRALKSTIKKYIQEAIRVENAGLDVEPRETSDFEIPEEFQVALDTDPALAAAFEALTPGRQRGYLHYFSSAKQSKTRESRVGRQKQRILDGKGLTDP